MSKKYLKAYDKWITVENDEQQEQQSDTSSDEITAANLLVKQYEKNEEILNSGDDIPESLVTESNHSYKKALMLLKKDIKKYNDLTLAQESYYETKHSLRLSNNKISILIDSLVDEKRLFKTKSGYTFSKEYSTFKWSNVLLGPLKVLWGALTDKTTTEIEKPGLLVRVMVTDSLGWLDNATSNFSRLPMFISDIVKGKSNTSLDYTKIFGMFSKKNFYRDIFTNCKKNHNEDLERLKIEFELFKKTIEIIKEDVCKPCDERNISGTERVELQKFDPIEANREMLEAIEHYKKNSHELVSLAESTADFVNSEILDYLRSKIHNN